jgi:hypothetical protein
LEPVRFHNNKIIVQNHIIANINLNLQKHGSLE